MMNKKVTVKLSFFNSESDTIYFEDFPFDKEKISRFIEDIEQNTIELFVVPNTGMYINIIPFLENIEFSISSIPIWDYLKNDYGWNFYDLEIKKIIIQKDYLELEVISVPE